MTNSTNDARFPRPVAQPSTKKAFVSTPDMAPVVSHTVRVDGAPRGARDATRDERAAHSLGVRLEGLVRERLLSRTWRARSRAPRAPAVALVVVSEAATEEERKLFARTAEDLRAAGDAAPRVLRVVAIAPSCDAFLTDLWTAGSARDLAALRWAPRERAEFVRQVATALEGLHAIGLVHGCLCPANVLLDDDLRPVLAEAGSVPVHALWARGADAELYATFAAPEVIQGAPPTARSDVYSVGRVLEGAFQGEHLPAIDAVVRRCLASDPAARYESAGALAASLDGILDQLPAADDVPSPPMPLTARPLAPPSPAPTPRPEVAPAPVAPRSRATSWSPPRWLAAPGAALAAGAFGLAAFAGGSNDALRGLLVGLMVLGAALVTTVAFPPEKARAAARLAIAAAAALLVFVFDPLSIAFRIAAQRHLRGDDGAKRGAIEEIVRLGRDFRGLSLARVDLEGVDLAGADLRGVDLSGANLTRARLFAAEVGGASFDGANLAGADLTQVQLELAAIASAACDASTRMPIDWHCREGRLARGAR
jgi:Protein kinase domain/Pentapeptide repeats (8 copies)